MRRIIVSLVVVFLLLTLPAVAQEKKPINLVYFVKVKSGSALQFEAALKKHVEWLSQQNENWKWGVWNRVIGDDLAVYAIGSFGHSFDDFDAHSAMAMANRQQWMATVAAHVESISSRLSVSRHDISILRDTKEPAALVWVMSQQYKVGTEDEFNYLTKRIHEAILKVEWPVHYAWSQVIAGGAGPTMTLVIPADNWAGMKGPEEKFEAMLERALGRPEADAIMKKWNKIVISEKSFIYAFRPDLSYMPMVE